MTQALIYTSALKNGLDFSLMWFGFRLGAGLLLFGLVVAVAARALALAVDLADDWSSRITPEEARRRARLTSLGRWPPMPAAWSTAGEWIALTVGLLLIALLTLFLRR